MSLPKLRIQAVNSRYREWFLMGAVSASALAASHFSWWSIGLVEAWGFVTGGVCVWLVVRENPWNWSIGLLNNVFFFVMFYRSALYADMGLQVVYFGLGIFGWVTWVRGGVAQSTLEISLTRRVEWAIIALFIPLTTFALLNILLAMNGAAPFWDAFSTVLSLVAQYLLCQKRLENWFFWIAADLIYVPLYWSKDLHLTALLYGIFLLMCLKGLSEWAKVHQRLRAHR